MWRAFSLGCITIEVKKTKAPLFRCNLGLIPTLEVTELDFDQPFNLLD
jgi:hypothetical protein